MVLKLLLILQLLDIEDKTVGIASTTNATDNSTADGAGIEIYASSSTAIIIKL